MDNRITFRVSETKQSDANMHLFLEKFPREQRHLIVKSIFKAVVDHVGINWNPLIDGYGSLLSVKETPQQAKPASASFRKARPEVVQNNNAGVVAGGALDSILK